jgi:hypothetical protein
MKCVQQELVTLGQKIIAKRDRLKSESLHPTASSTSELFSLLPSLLDLRSRYALRAAKVNYLAVRLQEIEFPLPVVAHHKDVDIVLLHIGNFLILPLLRNYRSTSYVNLNRHRSFAAMDSCPVRLMRATIGQPKRGQPTPILTHRYAGGESGDGREVGSASVGTG